MEGALRLPDRMGFYNFTSPHAMRQEFRRIRRWYKRCRKLQRWRRGILRNPHEVSLVSASRSVWTKKVDGHYRRLFKELRMEGLWAWRSVALSLRDAHIPVQSGTVPVERFWAMFKSMLPAASRKISLRWYNILSMLCMLRFNYTLFNRGALPAWAQRDSLLAQRIETLAMLTTSLDGVDGMAHLQPIFCPFAFHE